MDNQMNYKTYSAYKPSGVPWLGDVPEHWEIRKIKYTFKERVQKGFPNEALLAATQTKGVVPKSLYENRTVLVQKDFHLLKLVKKDDFVISLRSFQGGIEKAYYQGIISPAYTIIIPENIILPEYFKYLGKSVQFISLLKTCVTGIREGQNIDYNMLKRQSLSIPKSMEQTHIARFLDWKTSQINKFIKAKKRMLELLKEQKHAIINDAVTGKIDVRTGKPYTKYKPSCVEWLGDIPEEWEVRRLKNVAKLKSGESITSESIEDNGIYPVYGGNGLRGYTSNKTHNGEFVLIGRQGALCGNIHFVSGSFWASEHAVVLSSICSMDIKWISYTLKVMNLNQYSIAAAQPGLAVDRITILYIPFPSLKEQINIVNYIQEEISSIDLTISRIEREIELVQEYKTRLISDAVTGKIDIRGIEVPEVIEEIEEEIEEENDEVTHIEEEE